MSNTYKIQSTPVDVLIKQAKVYGMNNTMQIIYQQLEIIKEKNRNIVFLIRLRKLDSLINTFSKYNEKEFYIIFLEILKQINLKNLEEYNALVYFLEGLIKNTD